MTERSDEEFLAVEGLTKERAKRIYRRVVGQYRFGCGHTIYPAQIVQQIFTGDTRHGGHTSALQFLYDIGETSDSFSQDKCDSEWCDFIDCSCREECYPYKLATEDDEEDEE